METTKKVHQGHTLKRLREIWGYKQEYVALMLFKDESQQPKIARIEQKEVIDDETLTLFANLYKVDIQVIKKLEEDPGKMVFENNTFDLENGNIAIGNEDVVEKDILGDNAVQNINPLEEVLKLGKEKEALYERMLHDNQQLIEELRKRIATLEEQVKKE